ncbi:HlyD family secretion protein [Alkalimarinus alittae]|uniref:Efflux RND transporter periplasmic adaptor subunit n=1 Tax=Alkalimarinus alittae TaxID=2961619 RepID=A0ABY6N3H1_9ALTE|nr:efflux RND transporter periplasmic adaptor subunit [Alkalimarinus alittae]UZE96651.1 efflux RND transporter periplasmic adaptor subunit [Alkalimarinus alittae]
MELLVTIAYFCFVWIVFFKFEWLRFSLFWKFVVFGIYIGAALSEVVLLGQTTPYSKEMVVERYVIPVAPEFGGLVTEVHASANVPIKKGDPLFTMDKQTWQDKRDQAQAAMSAAGNQKKSLEAKLAEARLKLKEAKSLVAKKVMAARELPLRQDAVDDVTAQIAALDNTFSGLKAALDEANYNLEHATVVAPEDGYLVDFVLRPGAFIRIKQQVASFVSTEELYLLAAIDQRAAQWVRTGDKVHFALSMYPGRVFNAEVEHLIQATSSAQLQLSATLPSMRSLKPSEFFFVKLKPVGDFSETPLIFGASGLAAIFTGKSIDLVQVIRMIEIQSESILNYLYNPF